MRGGGVTAYGKRRKERGERRGKERGKRRREGMREIEREGHASDANGG